MSSVICLRFLRWKLSSFLLVGTVVPACLALAVGLASKERMLAAHMRDSSWEVHFAYEFWDDAMTSLRMDTEDDGRVQRWCREMCSEVWSVRKMSGFVRPAELDSICALRGIRSVSLSWCTLGVGDLRGLHHATSIEKLDLSGTSV